MVGKRSEEGGERSKKGEERWPGRRLIPLNPFLLQPADNINKLKCNEIINAFFYGHEKMNLWTGRFPSRNFYSSISFCHSSTSAIYTPASSEIQNSKGIDYSTFSLQF